MTFDPEVVHAKYLAERDKRLVPGRADIRDLTRDEHFARYRDDPFTPFVEREPVTDDVDVVIVGGGIAGLLAGAQLRKAGVERIRIIDQAGGIGGTWYWNRYPGVMCDVESYIYLPMLEELDYVPTRRYALGEEIRLHLQAIADRFDLVPDALFHTGVSRPTWDEDAGRWRIRTDRGDEFILPLLRAGGRDPQPDEAARHPRHGATSPAARSTPPAGTTTTPGARPDEPLTELGDKVVGLDRHRRQRASSACRRWPRPPSRSTCSSARRRRSACGATDPPTRLRRRAAAGLAAGSDGQLPGDHAGQARRRRPHRRRVDAPLRRGPPPAPAQGHDHRGVPPQRRGARLRDHGGAPAAGRGAGRRPRVAAEILKPYYRYLCKRPCFHDEYLDAFNRPNVTLVDCPAGIERITERGPVVDGKQYDVDCIVYGTGFEAEVTPLHRRAGHDIIGRGGTTLAEKWADGAASLFGMMSRGFPNLFVMPAPGQQAVVTVNYTQLAVLGAEFVAGAVALLEQRGVAVFDVSAEAEADWTRRSSTPSSTPAPSCRPARRPASTTRATRRRARPRHGNYGRGFGDYFAYRELLEGWLAAGDLDGSGPGVTRPPARRRRHRRGGGIGAAIAEAARPPGAFVVTVDPLVTARRLRAAPRSRGDHGRPHRRRRGFGPGLGGLGHRRDGRSAQLFDGTGRRVRPARRGDQRRRHHPAHQLRHGHRGRLARRARRCTSTATSTSSAPPCRSWPPPAAAASSASPPARDGGRPTPAPTAAPSAPWPRSPGSWVARRRRASWSTPCRPSPSPAWWPPRSSRAQARQPVGSTGHRRAVARLDARRPSSSVRSAPTS